MQYPNRSYTSRTLTLALLALCLTFLLAPSSGGFKRAAVEAVVAAAPPAPAQTVEPAPAAPADETDCEAFFTYQQVPGCNNYFFHNYSTATSGTPTYTWAVMDEDGNQVGSSVTSTNFTFSFPTSPDTVTYTVMLSASGTACGEDPDDYVQKITVPGIKADFTYEQASCPDSPLKVSFTNQSAGQGLSYHWNINGASFASPDPVYTFPGAGVYNVTLTVTSASGCTATKTTQVEVKTDCQPSFDYYYNSCGSTAVPVIVYFMNTSKGGFCPWNFSWRFGDTASNPSVPNNFGVVDHSYGSFGQYVVELTMKDGGTPACTKVAQQTIIVKPCEATFTYHVCPDGSVVFKTNSPNPKWQFPGGSPASGEGNEVKVNYGQPGTYSVTMRTMNAYHCLCVINKSVVIPKIYRCARNDHDAGQANFTYKGKQYKFKYKLVVRNFLFLHRIKARGVLYVKKGIFWVPTKAKEIRARWSGTTYDADSECCCVTPASENEDSGVQTDRVKAKKVHNIGHEFSVRENDITATFSVKVDAGHTPVVRTLQLGHDADKCKRHK